MNKEKTFGNMADLSWLFCPGSGLIAYVFSENIFIGLGTLAFALLLMFFSLKEIKRAKSELGFKEASFRFAGSFISDYLSSSSLETALKRNAGTLSSAGISDFGSVSDIAGRLDLGFLKEPFEALIKRNLPKANLPILREQLSGRIIGYWQEPGCDLRLLKYGLLSGMFFLGIKIIFGTQQIDYGDPTIGISMSLLLLLPYALTLTLLRKQRSAYDR